MSELPDVLLRLLTRGTPPWDDETQRGLDSLARLERRLGYAFERRELLRTALTLGSWCNEHRRAGWPSNACLEYFGDAVLGLAAADAVWRRFPDGGEGDLTRMRARLVSETALATVARDLELGGWLYLGRGDEQRGARDHDGTLADSLEAVLGAVFLDARHVGADPFSVASGFFRRQFGPHLDAMAPEDALDPKSRLQQRMQAAYRLTPVYVSLGEAGEGESSRWCARVELVGDGSTSLRILGEGAGRSLRAAEIAAASDALTRLDHDVDPG